MGLQAVFLFYLLIPFLCKFVQSLSEKEHRYLLFALLLIYTIMPSLMIEVVFNYVTWFSVLFVLSSYIRLHGEDSVLFAPGILDSKKVWGSGWWSCCCFRGEVLLQYK